MSGQPIELVLYHDVLCSWCYLADARLSLLREEYGPAVRFSYRAFPLRPAVPALIVGGDWLISGARGLAEYRELIERYRARQGPAARDRVLH